jgi:hypothetical protein
VLRFAEKALGARVIGTSGSAEKLASLELLSLDVALYGRGDFAQASWTTTNRHGTDLIVNTVGGTVFAENVRAGVRDSPRWDTSTVGCRHRLGTLREAPTVFGVSNKLPRPAAARPHLSRVIPFRDGRMTESTA